jgi:hypothetical protein
MSAIYSTHIKKNILCQISNNDTDSEDILNTLHGYIRTYLHIGGWFKVNLDFSSSWRCGHQKNKTLLWTVGGKPCTLFHGSCATIWLVFPSCPPLPPCPDTCTVMYGPFHVPSYYMSHDPLFLTCSRIMGYLGHDLYWPSPSCLWSVSKVRSQVFQHYVFSVFAKVDEGRRALVTTGSISFDVGVLQYDLFWKYFWTFKNRKCCIILLFMLFYSSFMNAFIYIVLNILVCVGQTCTCGLHNVV